jgi:hypothetical protein
MTYHLQIISAITTKHSKSKHINIEIDSDYQSFDDIEIQINKKFNKKLTDFQNINENEYLFNMRHFDENEKEIVSDYVIRIEERLN